MFALQGVGADGRQGWCHPCLTGYQRAHRSDLRQRHAAMRGQAAAAETLASADGLLRRVLADGEGPHIVEPAIENGGARWTVQRESVQWAGYLWLTGSATGR